MHGSPRHVLSLFWLPLVGLLLFMAACTGTPQEKKAKHLERGDKYFQAGKYNEALIEYKNVIQIDPRDATGHYKVAVTYLKIGGIANLRSGFAELTKTVEYDPELADAQFKLGELYLLSGEVNKAKEKAELALELNPDSAESQALLGKTFVVGKDVDQGIEALQEAIKLDPKRIQTYIDLAAVYLYKKDSASAQKTLAQALEADPKFHSSRRTPLCIRNLPGSTSRQNVFRRPKPNTSK